MFDELSLHFHFMNISINTVEQHGISLHREKKGRKKKLQCAGSASVQRVVDSAQQKKVELNANSWKSLISMNEVGVSKNNKFPSWLFKNAKAKHHNCVVYAMHNMHNPSFIQSYSHQRIGSTSRRTWYIRRNPHVLCSNIKWNLLHDTKKYSHNVYSLRRPTVYSKKKKQWRIHINLLSCAEWDMGFSCKCSRPYNSTYIFITMLSVLSCFSSLTRSIITFFYCVHTLCFACLRPILDIFLLFFFCVR